MAHDHECDSMRARRQDVFPRNGFDVEAEGHGGVACPSFHVHKINLARCARPE
jgi:hypothetical protein